MESLRKLETTVAGWYETIPHLPKAGQQWLAQNAWWIVLVGVILGSLGVIGMLSITMLAGATLVVFGGVVGAALGGLAFIGVLFSLVFAVANIVIGAIAISPLKALRYKGWSLLFLVTVINVIALALTFLFTLDLGKFIWGLLVTAVGAYFLFEVRDCFVTVKTKAKAKAKK